MNDYPENTAAALGFVLVVLFFLVMAMWGITSLPGWGT